MDLDDVIIAVFCLVHEAVPAVTGGRRLRQRGPQPILADSEVLTMEVVGEYLGLEQDSALFAYFRHHYAHFFPALRRLQRTTFVRQAANLWRVKERLWQHVLAHVPRDPHPRWSAQLSRVRYRIDTVFGQLVDRCTVKRVWARDLWHLCSRLLRKVLMQTLAVLLNGELGNPPLQLAQVVA